MGMTQTLLVVVAFIAALVALPWAIRWLQRRQQALGGAAAGVGSRVLSVVSVGPQQRVVTVEVGPVQQRTVLVLGVTAQNINCLHVLPAVATDRARFAAEMAAARAQPLVDGGADA